MRTYTIENETNNITVHATAQEADAVPNARRFRNEAGLAKLAEDWPNARLVEIWNTLPGVTPVNKFKDRNTAVGRVWKAIQSLEQDAPEAGPADLQAAVEQQQPAAETPAMSEAVESNGAQPEAPVAPAAEASFLPDAKAEQVATVGAQAADVASAKASATKKTTRAKKPPKPAEKAEGVREGSKTATVLGLLKRDGGVTSKELMSATGWQAHSVRGFLSGTVGKKMGLTVVSTKAENGERTYSIKA